MKKGHMGSKHSTKKKGEMESKISYQGARRKNGHVVCVDEEKHKRGPFGEARPKQKEG
ncbi:hypothetical protein SESBI_19711 [Sesbania bispinosa]|nr:hypothetical protein SESBI_19711 [Sesbania bispinosa]